MGAELLPALKDGALSLKYYKLLVCISQFRHVLCQIFVQNNKKKTIMKKNVSSCHQMASGCILYLIVSVQLVVALTSHSVSR